MKFFKFSLSKCFHPDLLISNVFFIITAVILPTLWLYLEHRFDAEQWFFGVVFASFCFSSLLSSPLFGFWVDYTQKTKPAILFANLFEIGGIIFSFMITSLIKFTNKPHYYFFLLGENLLIPQWRT